MSRRLDERTRALVAAPLVLAVVIAGWTVWTRSSPERQGGFCANATVEFAGVLQASDAQSDAGLGIVPDPTAMIRAAADVDVEQLQAGTPEPLRGPVAALVADLPDYQADRAAARARGAEDPPLPDALAAAFARLILGYAEHCR